VNWGKRSRSHSCSQGEGAVKARTRANHALGEATATHSISALVEGDPEQKKILSQAPGISFWKWSKMHNDKVETEDGVSRLLAFHLPVGLPP
jgi:hypothetical protein